MGKQYKHCLSRWGIETYLRCVYGKGALNLLGQRQARKYAILIILLYLNVCM